MNTTTFIKKQGKVIIAGAGPGDPDLITVKAAQWLQRAEVVITDRLVSPVLLKRYVSKNTLICRVGKQGGCGASVSQSRINDLIVFYAKQGKLVVRLKGGDATLFSNILDELQILVSLGIEYEIVPGITAASGAAAYSGIPLTARGYAQSVRYLTCHRLRDWTESIWGELARTEDTLVFYMSSENLEQIVDNLISAGIEKDKGLAIIEQASTPFQHVVNCSIEDFEKRRAYESIISPAIIVIGRVAVLNSHFSWMPDNCERKNYFEQLEDKKENYARA